MSESKVQVAVRIRPLSGKEKLERCTPCVQVLSERELMMGGDKQFTFDHVFGLESDQESIYSRCVSPLVENLFDGYNATVLAYGQTGSGKTYTMGSGCTPADALNPVADRDRGVIPRATAQIFDLITQRRLATPTAEFYLRVQFLELYGESLRDLLDPVGTAQGKGVSIRDGANDTLQIVGATEETVKTPQDMLALLERGTLCRTTGSTDMNTHSSRSHAIFTIVLEQQLKSTNDKDTGSGSSGDDAEAEYRTAKFHFVDLAGSERAKRTGATGQRMREGININMGLLALGNVISALGNEEGSTPKFVPYRDSRLTRMLQDSLGGNSRTLMIACVSPADSNFEETLNALRYANRARNIKNRAVINRDPASSQIAALKAQIAALKAHIANGGGAPVGMIEGEDSRAQVDYQNKCRMLEDEVQRLVDTLENEKRVRLELEKSYSILEAERMVLLGGSDTSSLEEEGEVAVDEESGLDEDEEEKNGSHIANDDGEEGGEGRHSLTGREEDDDDQNAKILKQRFHRSQRALKRLFTNYDETLRSKEEAMAQIVEERAKYEALKAHFESKMAEMNEEVKETQAQRESLELKLKELESEHQQTDHSRSEAARLRTLMAEKDKRLKELEARTQELHDARKKAAEWQKRESQVRSEIENVKKDKVELQRRMNENHKKHLEELREHKLEIAGLRRERARLEQDAKQLAARTERDTKMIQIKSEQVAAMQRKVREAQRVASHPKQLSQRDREQRKEIERLVALHVKRESELEDLRRTLKLKEEAIQRKERLLEQMKQLQDETGGSISNKEESIILHQLVPEASREDLKELEQRLEAADSEILWRDRQCLDVLQRQDESDTAGSEASEEVILTLASLDQAKDVCRVLLQMFVESKKELRERRVELERVKRQVIIQDKQVRFERKRTETLLLNSVASPTRHQQPASSPSEEHSSIYLIAEGGEAASTSTHPITPAKPAATPSQQALIASQARINTMEAKLRELRVDEVPVAAVTTDVSRFLQFHGESGNPDDCEGGERNSGSIGLKSDVFKRLASPSAFTGTHRFSKPHQNEKRRVSSSTQQQLCEEEECIDEITKVAPGHRRPQQQARKSASVGPAQVTVTEGHNTATAAPVSLVPMQEDASFVTAPSSATSSASNAPPIASDKFTTLQTMLAESEHKASTNQPEKPKGVNVTDRLSSHFTESYLIKRAQDFQARTSGAPSDAFALRRNTSPTRRAPAPPTTVPAVVLGPGKENNARPSFVSQDADTRRLLKDRMVEERERRRKSRKTVAPSAHGGGEPQGKHMSESQHVPVADEESQAFEEMNQTARVGMRELEG